MLAIQTFNLTIEIFNWIEGLNYQNECLNRWISKLKVWKANEIEFLNCRIHTWILTLKTHHREYLTSRITSAHVLVLLKCQSMSPSTALFRNTLNQTLSLAIILTVLSYNKFWQCTTCGHKLKQIHCTCSPNYSSSRLLPKKILKGPSELNAENLGAQHMKWKVLLWKIKAPRAILWEPQATGLLLGNSLVAGGHL